MNKLFIKLFALIIIASACKPNVVKYTINGEIKGGAGKFVKIIDMTLAGFVPDSIQLDMGGKFTFERITQQPGDYLFYFKNADYIRITPLPNETITLTSTYNNLLADAAIQGSPESEQISIVLKKHRNTLFTIDTLNQFYMQNQLNPELDTLIKRLTTIRDSVIHEEKLFLQKFIETKPGTFASYIALSQKIGTNLNLFTIENDLKYFEMVDTAMQNRFDTIAMVKMLHSYIIKEKRQEFESNSSKPISMIGKAAPNIRLPNINGDTLDLNNLNGKYVLIDFWGSWCRPCRKESENLRKAYLSYKNRGLDIFSVAIEYNKTDWKNTIREDKLIWKNHVSELNYMESKTTKLYGVKALPANFLIDAEGIVIAENIFGKELLTKLAEIFPYKPKPVQVVAPKADSTNASTKPTFKSE